MHQFVQQCPECAVEIDVSEFELLTSIKCPVCDSIMTVHGWIDHFQLVKVAGKGGMGIVYQAFDTVLNRSVALKLIRDDPGQNLSPWVKNFIKEAAITASINHPNVIQVFSTGFSSAPDIGRFYIVMELAAGGSLGDLIKLRGKLPEAEVLEIGIEIARGLEATLAEGLIHRDVKPGNILFAESGGAKVVDFGLALLMEESAAANGEIWGTPYYVAPEKLENQPEDFRSDIYSLGATLFHALAGRPPFEAESSSLVALKHLKSQPVGLQAFAPWVSGATAYVINRTLLKSPADRYQSYAELVEHLEYAREQLASGGGDFDPQKSRIVLEDTGTKKVMSWMTLMMLGLILAVVTGAFVFRSHSSEQSPTLPTPAAAQNAELTILSRGLQLLINGNPDSSAAEFRRLAQSTSTQKTHHWAVFFEGMAQLAAGKRSEANAIFNCLTDRAVTPKIETDFELAAFFAKAAREILKGTVIDPGNEPNHDSQTYESLALLLFALQDWNLGEMDKAEVFFRRFRSATLGGSLSWINELKPVAELYIAQLTAYHVATQTFEASRNSGAKLAAIAAFKTLPQPLRIKGSALTDSFLAEMSRPPSDGVYQLINRRSKMALEASEGSSSTLGLHQARPSEGNVQQQWRVAKLENSTYSLTLADTALALDVAFGSPDDGAYLRSPKSTPNDAQDQQWQVIGGGDGYFQIISMRTGRMLSAAVPVDGGKVAQWKEKNTPDQQWSFTRISRPSALTSTVPGGWSLVEIGPETKEGALHWDADNSSYAITGSAPGIYGASDGFHFVNKPVSGDFELVVRILSIKSTAASKFGIMLRSSREGGASNVANLLQVNGKVALQCRPADGEQTINHKSLGAQDRPPTWLKLSRRGAVVSGAFSSDGKAWQERGTFELMPRPTDLLGIAYSARDVVEVGAASFDQLQLQQLTRP